VDEGRGLPHPQNAHLSARNKASLALRNKERKGFAGELRAQYTGARFSDPQNTVKVRPFWVWARARPKSSAGDLVLVGRGQHAEQEVRSDAGLSHARFCGPERAQAGILTWVKVGYNVETLCPMDAQ